MPLLGQYQLIVAVAFGALLAFLKGLPGIVFGFVLDKFTVSLEVLDKDESYRWINAWLSESMDRRQVRNVMVVSYPSPEGESRYRVTLVPGIGVHSVRFEGVLGIVYKSRKESKGIIPSSSESLIIRLITRDVQIAQRLVDAAMKISTRPEPGIVDVYIPRWGSWSKAGVFEARRLDSLILANGYEIVRDIDKFLKSKVKYRSRSIPYQRGYLFYGPPGNGKTSCVKAVAGHFGLSVYLVDLNDKKLSDLDLQWLFASIPSRSLLLLEDVHMAEVSRQLPVKEVKEGEPKSENEGISLSGLLNALDGILSGETGRIVVMTTNNPECLPEALIRAGRVDKKFKFPNANSEDAVEAVKRFFGVNGCTAITGSIDLSFADLQNVLMVSSDAGSAISVLESTAKE